MPDQVTDSNGKPIADVKTEGKKPFPFRKRFMKKEDADPAVDSNGKPIASVNEDDAKVDSNGDPIEAVSEAKKIKKAKVGLKEDDAAVDSNGDPIKDVTEAKKIKKAKAGLKEDDAKVDSNGDAIVSEDAAVDSNGDPINEDDAKVDSNGDPIAAVSEGKATAKKRKGDAVGRILEDADCPTTKTGMMAAVKGIDGMDDDTVKEFRQLNFETAKKVYKEMKAGKKKPKAIMASYRENEQPAVQDMGDPFASTSVKLGEQLGTIFAGQDLTEEFKTKTTTLFETVINARVEEEVLILEAASKKEINKRIKQLKEAMVVQVDKYLGYIVEGWLEENRLAVETGLKTEITEDFIVGLKSLFVEHNINIPAEDESILEEALKEKAELESEVTKLLESTSTLKEQVIEFKKREILEAVSQNLADTQFEKLVKLAETVEFKDDKQYQEQVKIIKEHYFPNTKVVGNKEVSGEAPSTEKKTVPSHIAEAASYISKGAKR